MTAFGRRKENNTQAQTYICRDIFDLTREDLAGVDAVVDAFGVWNEADFGLYSTTLTHLCDILFGTKVRLLVVGGAGSLYVNPEHTKTLSQEADFPEAFKPLANAAAKSLGELRKRDDVIWTYVSPAADFQAEGERTGSYLLGGEELRCNDRGESVISYADYAIAMVDEIERGEHLQERIGVVRA